MYADDRQKTCTMCSETKPVSEFYQRPLGRVNEDGTPAMTYRSHCKACTYIGSRGRHRETYEVIAAIKVERGCTDCGYNAHAAALHFDHLPQFKKSFGIASAVTSKPLKKILAEIEKCEVVCGNCHAIRTYERRRAEGVTWDVCG